MNPDESVELTARCLGYIPGRAGSGTNCAELLYCRPIHFLWLEVRIWHRGEVQRERCEFKDAPAGQRNLLAGHNKEQSNAPGSD